MERTKALSPDSARRPAWRDTLASVVFHGMELLCVALVFDRIPLLGTAFSGQDTLTHTAASRALFEIGDFVGSHRPFVLLGIAAVLVVDAMIMARLWARPKTRAARLWFTVIAAVPLLGLAAVLGIFCLSLSEALAR
jgi:hypothetical protein